MSVCIVHHISKRYVYPNLLKLLQKLKQFLSRNKQDVIIADATSTAPLTLWEQMLTVWLMVPHTPSLICLPGHFKARNNSLLQNSSHWKPGWWWWHWCCVGRLIWQSQNKKDAEITAVLSLPRILLVSHAIQKLLLSVLRQHLQKVGYCTCAMPERLDKCIKQVSVRVIVQADIYSIEDPTSLLPLLAAIWRSPPNQIDIDTV